jgi:phage shock protein C
MSTRTRRSTVEEQRTHLFEDHNLDLESVSDDELEQLLFEEEEVPTKGPLNLPTMAGLSLILVGIAYILQQMGIWSPLDLSALAAMLPWLAGILIILLGFGVLSWRPRRRPRKRDRRKQAVSLDFEQSGAAKARGRSGDRRKLYKSRDRKVAGVCGGLAEYFGIDPTLMRIAFVIGTIVTQGTLVPAYIILAFVMPNPEKQTPEERITIIRDS